MSAEESKENIITPVQGENGVRMAGYLDKRGKIKLMSTWKRYWFVLEGRLLLYYKSQVEYLKLSACRGSLNMGLVSNVRPGSRGSHGAGGAQGYTIEVVTRTQVITLRTKERTTQEQWLQALLSSMVVSAPVRTSCGPVHFRYSLDNLPAATEVEKNDMTNEKQMTLPHRTSIARQNSLLARIKNMGGQTYGGSLETIVKNQKQHNSPQQPKIPHIKAVDKMVGFHSNENGEAEEQDDDWSKITADVESQYLEDDDNQNDMTASTEPNKETAIQNSGSITIINIENQNNNIPGDTNADMKSSSNCNHQNSESDILIENKYYEKMQVINEEKEDSLIKPGGEMQSLKNGDKMYEEVKCIKHTGKNNEVEDKDDNEMNEEDTYDQVTMLKSENFVPEPDLPPRPGSNTQSKYSPTEGTNKYEDDYSMYYETTESYSADQPSSSPRATSSAGEGTPSEKKKLKLRNKMRLRRKKSTSKESVASEGAMSPGEKKKHKTSFLSRMFKRYHKKRSKSNELIDDHCSSDEPEYETVDYVMAQQTEQKTENNSVPLESPNKEKLFCQSILPGKTMLELEMKLKNREKSPENLIALTKEGNAGCESILSQDPLEKKPVPTPRMNKSNLTENGPEAPRNAYYSRINRSNRPPMLPPRGIARPPSPFHDIPTNNSPVYGNFQDLGLSPRTQNSLCKAPSKLESEESNQEIEDELLGTPQGFAAIQKKWRAVEKSVELQRDQGRLSLRRLPPKGRSLEKSCSVENCKAEQCSKMTKCSSTEACIPLPKKHVVRTLSLDTCSRTSCSMSHMHLRKSDSYLPAYKPSPPRRHSQDEHIINAKYMTSEKVLEEKVSETCCQNFSQNCTFVADHEKSSAVCDSCSPVTLRHSVQQYTAQHSSNPQDFANPTVCICTHKLDQLLKESSNQEEIEPLNHTECDGVTPVLCYSQRHADANMAPGQQNILPCLNRYSDELNRLLVQLAEITSAPLLPPGAATSMLNLPEGKKPNTQSMTTTHSSPIQAEQFVLGPIRRRRHSDPDYDVPRPHGSLLHLLPSGKMSVRHSDSSKSGRESDRIEAPYFFGEVDLGSESPHSSMSLRHSVISEVEDPADSINVTSITPDSLEVPSAKCLEPKIEVR